MLSLLLSILNFRTEHTITIATTFATVYCAMLALGIPIEGKRLPGRILILTVCLSGKEHFINCVIKKVKYLNKTKIPTCVNK